ncbi:M43 family zinc metalloprotease [Dyadobacter luteus]|nr:M43 family zinc metalloprotease [Dyadobacter luteus]
MNLRLRITALIAHFITLLLLVSTSGYAQERCGTMEALHNHFLNNPAQKISFENREVELQRIINQRVASGKTMRTTGTVTIPVVFHIVMRRPTSVTDSQILAQLDTVNRDYAGLNQSNARILAAFRDVYGSSGIEFCLAQRTPDDQPTTGIVRYTTTQTGFTDVTGIQSGSVKHASTGGADSWDPTRYLNIWVCDFTNNLLGYATFPNTGRADEQGVVINQRSLPGGSAASYNYGKTLTHELGHFFNLYHIWGDDNGSCAGTDYIDDTPNQGKETEGLPTGIVTDYCSPSAPGIMYQNYMDYTYDAGLLMFTKLQVARMEAAFSTYRSSLGASNACVPITINRNDAQLKFINSPDQRLCEASFTPQITIENRGSQTLTSLIIEAKIDDGTVVRSTWTGSVPTYQQALISLPEMQTAEGNHAITITISSPNGVADEDISTDVLTKEFMYYEPVEAPVREGFENSFLPVAWDIVNEDAGITWERTNRSAKTGTYSVRINNMDNVETGQKDYLRSPTVNIANVDSAFVSFQVAAASYANSSAQTTMWDTLQVLISTDCGKTYTSVYKKWGASLVTRTGATRTEFVPGSSEWRREEINLGRFISNGEVLVAFQNITGNGNNIYLDDINIRTVTVNPNLKEEGFLVTPNPTDGAISVQFYPHPATLKAIQIYNVSGQLMVEREIVNGQVPGNIYDFMLTNCNAGLYVVRAVFEDKVLTKKFVKVK